MLELSDYHTEFTQQTIPDHLQQLSQTGIELLEAARFETHQHDADRQQPWFDITRDFRTGLVEAHFTPQQVRAHWERHDPQNPVFYDRLVVGLVNNSLVIALNSRRDTRAWSDEHNCFIETENGTFSASAQITSHYGELYERNPVRASHSVKPLQGRELASFAEHLDRSISVLDSYRAIDELRQAS